MRYSLLDKARRIKPFVNFNVNLTKAKAGTLDAKTKRLINEYFKIIDGSVGKDAEGRDHYTAGLANGLKYQMVPPKGERKAYETLAGQPEHFLIQRYKDKKGRNRTRKVPALKGIWFDTVQGKTGKLLKPKIKKDRQGRYSYSVGGVRFGFLPFNTVALVKDAGAEIQRIFDMAKGSEKFAIKCGQSQTKIAWSKTVVMDKIREYMAKYPNWEKWLLGLIPLEYENQNDFGTYRDNRARLVDANKKRRAKERKAFQREQQRNKKRGRRT